jgi:hypothetical protein
MPLGSPGRSPTRSSGSKDCSVLSLLRGCRPEGAFTASPVRPEPLALLGPTAPRSLIRKGVLNLTHSPRSQPGFGRDRRRARTSAASSSQATSEASSANRLMPTARIAMSGTTASGV